MADNDDSAQERPLGVNQYEGVVHVRPWFWVRWSRQAWKGQSWRTRLWVTASVLAIVTLALLIYLHARATARLRDDPSYQYGERIYRNVLFNRAGNGVPLQQRCELELRGASNRPGLDLGRAVQGCMDEYIVLNE